MHGTIQGMDPEAFKRAFGDALQTISDVVTNLRPVLHDAVRIVERQEQARTEAARPFVYGLPKRYYDTEPKRRFLLDNRRDYQHLVTLRHALRNAMKADPRTYNGHVYAIFLVSGDDLALALNTTAHDARETLKWLSQWGYARRLRVVNEGLARLGTAWLFGRMLHKGARRPEPTWLEPPCIVPPNKDYEHDPWQGPCEWAGGGDALCVPPTFTYRPAAAMAAPDAGEPSTEATALAEAIRGR